MEDNMCVSVREQETGRMNQTQRWPLLGPKYKNIMNWRKPVRALQKPALIFYLIAQAIWEFGNDVEPNEWQRERQREAKLGDRTEKENSTDRSHFVMSELFCSVSSFPVSPFLPTRLIQ